MIPHNNIRKQAEKKTMSRDGLYGKLQEEKEAWQTMKWLSLAEGARYKIDRAIQPQTVKEKALDDLEDAYNYIAALYERILEES